jgi:hypothetical protein
MKIHKNWNDHDREYLKSTYKMNEDAFNQLATMLSNKEQFVIKEIIKKFDNYAKPPTKFYEHLLTLNGEYEKRNSAYYKNLMKGLKSKMTVMNKEMIKYRQGFQCNLCNWRNHGFYNPQSLTVTYSSKFCLGMILKFVDTLWEKFGEVYRFINIMDEFMFLISGKRLIEQVDHAIFHRYIMILKKCRADNTKIENCSDVCREFNLNRFNYMWDGEAVVIKLFLKNYSDLWEKLGSDATMTTLFNFRKEQWSSDKLSKFISEESVISQQFVEPPFLANQKKNSFDLDFKTSSAKSFVEHFHPTNSVQIETLDDELSSYSLYKMNDPPVDISQFLIVFDPNTGIDLTKDSEQMNFDTSVDQILALLNTSGGNVKTLDEVIDDPVKVLMRDCQITDIASFVNDPYMEFAQIVKPKKPKVAGERSLKSAGRIAGFLAALTALLLV